jgi:hypothetical protein
MTRSCEHGNELLKLVIFLPVRLLKKDSNLQMSLRYFPVYFLHFIGALVTA